MILNEGTDIDPYMIVCIIIIKEVKKIYKCSIQMVILSKNVPFATVTSRLNPPLQATVSFDAIFCFILFYCILFYFFFVLWQNYVEQTTSGG